MSADAFYFFFFQLWFSLLNGTTLGENIMNIPVTVKKNSILECYIASGKNIPKSSLISKFEKITQKVFQNPVCSKIIPK